MPHPSLRLPHAQCQLALSTGRISLPVRWPFALMRECPADATVVADEAGWRVQRGAEVMTLLRPPADPGPLVLMAVGDRGMARRHALVSCTNVAPHCVIPQVDGPVKPVSTAVWEWRLDVVAAA